MPIAWKVILNDEGKIIADGWSFVSKENLENRCWVQENKGMKHLIQTGPEVFSYSIESRENALKEAERRLKEHAQKN